MEGSLAMMSFVLLLPSWSPAPNRCQRKVLLREKRTSRMEPRLGDERMDEMREEYRYLYSVCHYFQICVLLIMRINMHWTPGTVQIFVI